MGKGDIKTRKGKIKNGSFGNKRKSKTKKIETASVEPKKVAKTTKKTAKKKADE